MIDLELIKMLVIVLGTGIAAFTDFKTGFIHNWLTYPMIGLGLIFTLLNFQIENLLIPIAVFIVGYIFYFLGKTGGGDVKLFTAIALLMPFFNEKIFIISLILVSALLATFFISIYYVLKLIKKGIDWQENKQGIFNSFLLLIVLILYFFTVAQFGLLSVEGIFVLAIPMFFALIFLAFQQGIRKEFFVKEILVKELEEDEVIASEFESKEVLELLGNAFKGIITDGDKKLLEKNGITKIKIYRNLPAFAPFIFLAVLLLFIFPDLFSGLLFF